MNRSLNRIRSNIDFFCPGKNRPETKTIINQTQHDSIRWKISSASDRAQPNQEPVAQVLVPLLPAH